ncbi:unnamed protein product [Lactuca virosa]|uniref:Uncharacterized protein n=1 Tax=Lactuca virosa TaxID=75947 RepID=A0AAU9M100_9ASTR|nr:unnamed protein product [Lactuca virosa]
MVWRNLGKTTGRRNKVRVLLKAQLEKAMEVLVRFSGLPMAVLVLVVALESSNSSSPTSSSSSSSWIHLRSVLLVVASSSSSSPVSSRSVLGKNPAFTSLRCDCTKLIAIGLELAAVWEAICQAHVSVV